MTAKEAVEKYSIDNILTDYLTRAPNVVVLMATCFAAGQRG